MSQPTYIDDYTRPVDLNPRTTALLIIDLKPETGDLVLNKNSMGAFGSTGIDAHLKSMGISELVMVGVSTNNCVGMTAMEASDRQYGVAIVSDATGTCSDDMQDAYLKTWRRLWGRVASTDEVIAELRGTGTQRRTG